MIKSKKGSRVASVVLKDARVYDILLQVLAIRPGAIRCDKCMGAGICECTFCNEGPCPYCRGIGSRNVEEP